MYYEEVVETDEYGNVPVSADTGEQALESHDQAAFLEWVSDLV